MIRAVDRIVGGRGSLIGGDEIQPAGETEEARLRWALGDDYEVLSALGRGSFGIGVARPRPLARPRGGAEAPPPARRERRARRRTLSSRGASSPRSSPTPPSSRSSTGTAAARSPGTRWSWPRADRSADLVARAGPRPLSEIAPQVDFVLAGLAAAHSIGIVHRDLKPENILIDRYRRWRIADFGIANAPGEERAGTSGTPAFAAPEQLLGEQQDTAADCFSLAAIVAFALSGSAAVRRSRREFDSRARAGRRRRPPPFDPEIARWITRGLAPDVKDRFADAARDAARLARGRAERALP